MRKEAGCQWCHSKDLTLVILAEIFKDIGAGPIL
jgi:hypothetical protein